MLSDRKYVRTSAERPDDQLRLMAEAAFPPPDDDNPPLAPGPGMPIPPTSEADLEALRIAIRSRRAMDHLRRFDRLFTRGR